MLQSSFSDREVFDLIRREVSNCVGIEFQDAPVVMFCGKPEVADFSMAMAKFASERKLKPNDLSIDFAQKINNCPNREFIIEAAADKIFVNLKVDHGRIFDMVCRVILEKGNTYGSSQLENPKKVIIEHTSANPNSSLHIGNLRSVVIGAHLARLMKWVGYDVRELYFVNDLGAQIGLTAVGYSRINEILPGYKPDQFNGFVYAIMNTFASAQKLGLKISDLRSHFDSYDHSKTKQNEDDGTPKRPEEEVIATACRLHHKYTEIYDLLNGSFSDDENISELAAKLNQDYEAKVPEAVVMFRKMCNATLTGIQQTLDCYGIHHDRFDFESEISWDGTSNALIQTLKQSPFFHEQTQCNSQGKPEGAYLDLDGYLNAIGAKRGKGGYANPYPPFYLIRPDGTTLYTLRDVAYSMKKISEADMVLNVICTEQNLPQEKVVLTLQALGIPGRPQFHMAYELVKLMKAGKVQRMSGRKGFYRLADDLYNKVKEATRQVMADRERQKISIDDESSVERVTHTVANASIKYSLLGISPRMPIDFDVAKAVDPTGNSAAFILYTAARISSIIRKFEKMIADGQIPPESEQIEWHYLANDSTAWEILTKYLMVFASESVRAACPEIPPAPKLPEFGSHIIPCFAFNLSRVFSSYYGRVQIIKAGDPAMYPRIALCRSLLQVLHNSMRLFMVEPLEEM